MNIEMISAESDIPQGLIDYKIEHYKDVFKHKFDDVYEPGTTLEGNKEMIVLNDFGKVVGGCVVEKRIYEVKFQDFSILPGNRGHGYAKRLMNELENVTQDHHEYLINSNQKPNDIKEMYLQSLIYMDANKTETSEHVLQFAPFLKNMGFLGYRYNKYELYDGEKNAIKAYQELYPNLINRLRVFKKKIVDDGVLLNSELKEELLALDKKQWDITMGGLNWKLGNYGKTGEVSYKFEICPICDDMGSSEMNSAPCKECYIHKTCTEPFRELGFFKENYEISNSYFTAMREFMLENKQKK